MSTIEVKSATGMSIVDALEREPYRYEFFQAIRLLNIWAAEQSRAAGQKLVRPVGYDFQPHEEVVRFCGLVSHSFPASEIVDVRAKQEDDAELPLRMVVAFMGLTGPQGVLPRHYTQSVIDECRDDRNALRDFLDLFNHRLISLFYRSWEKYRFPIKYERDQKWGGQSDDLFTNALYSLVGMGTGGLRRRLTWDDELLVYYSGHFSRQQRSAESLERMVEDSFGFPAKIIQFVGQWLLLEQEDQTSLPTPELTLGRNTVLGQTAIAGDRVWGIENKFRIRLGPMGYDDFFRLIPGAALHVELAQFIRQYAGPDFDVEIQPVLLRDEVPEVQLDDKPSLLGWNTWMGGGVPLDRDADEAVFGCDGSPLRI